MVVLSQCDGAEFYIHPHTITKKHSSVVHPWTDTSKLCKSSKARRGPVKVQMFPLYAEGANVLQAHAYHGPAPSTFTQHFSKGAAAGSPSCTCSAIPEA